MAKKGFFSWFRKDKSQDEVGAETPVVTPTQDTEAARRLEQEQVEAQAEAVRLEAEQLATEQAKAKAEAERLAQQQAQIEAQR
ncbi:signal recognition particle receptor protein FtsY (alpha subunit) [Shewanella sp. HN-41]|nr:signal recognition particle receptor protein FtsY (alpha subunit) [Shewanella sp. HN-41]